MNDNNHAPKLDPWERCGTHRFWLAQKRSVGRSSWPFRGLYADTDAATASNLVRWRHACVCGEVCGEHDVRAKGDVSGSISCAC